MGVAKAKIGNSSYIGAFAFATDSYALITPNATKTERSIIEENLETDAFSTTIDGSDLVGIYAVGNSKGLILPEMSNPHEIKKLKKELSGIEVSTIRTDLNALRNNILVNDRFAFVNPEYKKKEVDEIAHALDVEVIPRQIGTFATVGANNILTNRGIVLNNGASEHDINAAKKFMQNVSQTTANVGSSSIGLCAVANSKGLVVGGQTTGFELARIAEGLDL